MEDRQYKQYINGLKGFACLLILFGHFLGIYRYAEQFLPRMPFMDTILASPVSFLFDEGYWLFLFFVVSGYLVAQSKVRSFAGIVHQSVKRFFRFAFPILFSYLVIFVIYRVFGFHTADTKELFRCKLYQAYYTKSFTFKEVLLGPVKVLFFGWASFDSPYWVLRGMFMASVLIYVLKYVYTLIGEKHPALCFSLLMAVTLGSAFLSRTITACLMGMLIALYEGKRIAQKGFFAFWMIACSMLLYVMPENLLSALFFSALVLYIPRVRWLNAFFSSRFCRFFGDISWGIYSFHWPVICSVGGMMMLALTPKAGLVSAYLAACAASLALTVLLAAANRHSFEIAAAKLTGLIDGLLRKALRIEASSGVSSAGQR